MINRVFSILGAQWLIHQDTAISHLPVLISLMKGQDLNFTTTENEKPYVLAFAGPSENISLVGRWDLRDSNIPENSVAIIQIGGLICSWDSISVIEQLRSIKDNDLINSVVIVINSPGGMVAPLDLLSNSIKSLGKPSIVMITGMCASGAMWVASAADYRIATSRIDVIGSIGTKTSIQDNSAMLEKEGIKITDIYATLSTRKDEESRSLMEKKDTAPMVAFLDFINDHFHQTIRENLNISAESEVFTGAAFFAEKAQQLGLINEINTMDYALQKAYSLGLKHKIINQSKSLNF